jgi:transposase-like protein
MTHLEVTIQDQQIQIQSQAFCCTFLDVGKNRKPLFVFLRSLCSPETGKELFTHQQIAEAFGYKHRQNIDNFVGEFRQSGEDFQVFLTRANTKRERVFPLIEEQILECPWLSPHQQYLAFCEAHPEERVSEKTFRQYIQEVDGLRLLKCVQRVISPDTEHFDARRYLHDLLEADQLHHAKKKEIVERFPDARVSSSLTKGARFEGLSTEKVQKKLLVVLLYACTVSQDVLALLCGVGKTSIHNWIYDVCGEELEWQILREIVCWSGRVSFDEKWVKINGEWWFVLCAVDAVSGFPLLMGLYPTCDTRSWTLFFLRFTAIYGMPRLIVCDGSTALAAARQAVFPRVRFQLCKFHKLKNLMKRLRRHLDDSRRLTRCVRLARHMFTNSSTSSRKAAAKRLQQLAGPEVASYLETHIVSSWRNLTLSLTTNASERFNRKIERTFAARYGVATEESAKVLLRSLWLKELMLNGQKHIEETSELRSLDVSRICQQHLDIGNIQHFFHDSAPSQVEKLA